MTMLAGVDGRVEALDQIWVEYQTTRKLVDRNALTIAYQRLVTQAVRRLPSHVQRYWGHDELESFGQDGLLKAVERWDGQTAKFDAYALKRIRGAIFDEFRRLDWVPRSIRERINSYRIVHDLLTHHLRRNPSHQEVFVAMGLDDRRGSELLLELRASQLLHLSGAVDGGSLDHPLADLLHSVEDEPETRIAGDLLAAELEGAMATLPARERAIIYLAFMAGLPQDQIGDIIGVGGSQVCKIQARALRKLRSVLEPIYTEQTPWQATA